MSARHVQGMIQMAGKAGSKVIFVPMPALAASPEGLAGAVHYNQLEQMANQEHA